MLKNLFICRDGAVVDDGSESNGGAVYPEIDGERFAPLGHIHERMIFVGVTDDEWALGQRSIVDRGGCLVVVTT